MWDEYKASKMEIATQVQATWGHVHSQITVQEPPSQKLHFFYQKLVSNKAFFLVLHTERVNLENKRGKYRNISQKSDP